MSTASRSRSVLVPIVVGLAAARASAQALHTTLVASGFVRPTCVAPAPYDETHVFVCEQWTGNVRVVRNGVLLAPPFVTVGPVATGPEQGLLGLAFHPRYASNGRFYVDFVDANGTNVVREYTVDPTDPERADPATARTVLEVALPFQNHQGGCIQFGADDLLYVAIGDGGAAFDPANHAQSTTDLLGKLLRIDVDGDDFPGDATRNYAIPPTNPFVGTASAPEIWCYGLANPWRFSFDHATGALFVGDVGQSAWEEIDYAANGEGGLDYGWRCMEGFHCTGLPACTCDTLGQTYRLPLAEFPHSAGACAVIGGVVYRGNDIPALQGTYFYADFCTGRIWSFVHTPGNSLDQFRERTAELDPAGPATIAHPVAFGEDPRGELLILEQDGELWRVESTLPGIVNCPGDGTLATPCPCGNDGDAGRGCASSAAAGGARLEAHGALVPDTLQLAASALPGSSGCIFLASDGFDPAGAVFGDGVLCLAGTLHRLFTTHALEGSAAYPRLADPPISDRLMVTQGSGVTTFFQVFYRNSAPWCTPATFNTTNGWVVTW